VVDGSGPMQDLPLGVTPSGNVQNGAAENKLHLPSPIFCMGCYVCSVRNGRWFCSVHNGAGSRTSAEQKFNQVMEASATTPWVLGMSKTGRFRLTRPKIFSTNYNRLNGKEGIPTTLFFILESTMDVIKDRAQSALVSHHLWNWRTH
jgi:hypothetical protein